MARGEKYAFGSSRDILRENIIVDYAFGKVGRDREKQRKEHSTPKIGSRGASTVIDSATTILTAMPRRGVFCHDAMGAKKIASAISVCQRIKLLNPKLQAGIYLDIHQEGLGSGDDDDVMMS